MQVTAPRRLQKQRRAEAARRVRHPGRPRPLSWVVRRYKVLPNYDTAGRERDES
jgi:hypothetical protein